MDPWPLEQVSIPTFSEQNLNETKPAGKEKKPDCFRYKQLCLESLQTNHKASVLLVVSQTYLELTLRSKSYFSCQD